MNKKLRKHIDEQFEKYGNFPALKDVKEELLANLEDKLNDFKAQGHSESEAYQLTIESIGDIAEIMEQLPSGSSKPEISKKPKKVSGSSLPQADLTGADLEGLNFSGSDLRQADFSGSNLKDASLHGSDLVKARFDHANLTNTRLTASDLTKATFDGSTLVNTNFSTSDLSGSSFDGTTLTGVSFDSASLNNTSFKNAILQDVSFHHTAAKRAIFDGATMDKLTHALLKSANATLNDIKFI